MYKYFIHSLNIIIQRNYKLHSFIYEISITLYPGAYARDKRGRAEVNCTGLIHPKTKH